MFAFSSGLCLQPSPILVTANDLRVVKVNAMIWVGLQVSAY